MPPASASPPVSVAIVEDDESIRGVLEQWLQDSGNFRCAASYRDAESAVAAMPAARPQVALVDVNLPGWNGIECVRRLKMALPETQFVMLTIYDDATHIFDALAAGATGYLLKRSTREELIRALQEVQAGGSPMTSNIARKVVQSLQRPAPAAQLSPRENQVLELLAQGYLYKEIAATMEISLPTVNSFVRRIYEKLHVHSRAQAVAHYTQVPRRRDAV